MKVRLVMLAAVAAAATLASVAAAGSEAAKQRVAIEKPWYARSEGFLTSP